MNLLNIPNIMNDEFSFGDDDLIVPEETQPLPAYMDPNDTIFSLDEDDEEYQERLDLEDSMIKTLSEEL